MKKTIVLIILGFYVLQLQSQTAITPQIGVNGSYLTNEFTGITFSSQVGYQFGVNVRFGRFFHIQPCIF
jgi:hypothetical protein